MEDRETFRLHADRVQCLSNGGEEREKKKSKEKLTSAEKIASLSGSVHARQSATSRVSSLDFGLGDEIAFKFKRDRSWLATVVEFSQKEKKKKKKKKKNVPVHLYENYRKNRAVESLVKRKSSLFDRPFVLSELEKRNSRSSLGTEVEKELCTGFLGYLWTDSLPLGHGELFPEFVEKRRGDYRVKRCVLSRSVGFARPLAWKIQKSVLCEQRFRRPHFRTSFSYFPNRIPYGTELLEFYKKERSHSFRF